MQRSSVLVLVFFFSSIISGSRTSLRADPLVWANDASETLTFIEDAPHALLLRQEPAVEARDLLQVRASTNEEESKHKDAVEGVDCEQIRAMKASLAG